MAENSGELNKTTIWSEAEEEREAEENRMLQDGKEGKGR